MKQFNIIFDLKNPKFLNGEEKLPEFEFPIFLNQNITVNYFKIEDITDDETYFLFIKHTDIIRENFSLSKGFPKNIKNAISNHNLKIIFISPHESHINTQLLVQTLTDIIKINDWKEKNFYIINNNSMIYNIKEKFNSNINFYKMNYLMRLISSQTKPLPSTEDIYFNKKFIFLCFNRIPNNHRITLLCHLNKLKLLENDITDWSWLCPYSTSYKNVQSIEYLKKYIKPTDKNLIKIYFEILQHRKLGFYEEKMDWFKNGTNWSPEDNTIDSFQNSYINIVTETFFGYIEHNVHITEKSFKPFYYFQIPIFLASWQHVKMMREEYSFNFFDDLIDHSYDDEKDDVKRFYMVIKEIQRLSNMREEISTYYKNNIDKLIHNHNFIKTYSEKQIEENYFFNLIK